MGQSIDKAFGVVQSLLPCASVDKDHELGIAEFHGFDFKLVTDLTVSL